MNTSIKKLKECLSQKSSNCLKFFKTTNESRFCPQCTNTIKARENATIESNYEAPLENERELVKFWRNLK